MGDQAAEGRTFEEAYVELLTRARRVAGRIVAGSDDADDIAAETLARAYVRWSSIDGHAAPWVTRVATNLAIDRVRRKTPQVVAVSSAAADDRVVDRLDVARRLRQLPRRQAQAVALRYLVGLREGEIAHVLAMQPGTVKTHLQRGMGRLRLEERCEVDAP